MEIEHNREKFSFFTKTDKKPGKHKFILAGIADFEQGCSISFE